MRIPTAPCKLPNSFLADPPLKKVVAKTLEFGARGKTPTALERGHLPHRPVRRHPVRQQRQRHQRRLLPERRQDPAPGSRADGSDEVGSARHRRPLRFHRRDLPQRLRQHSPANSSADANGDIVVASGNRIPGIPQHTLRVRLDYAANDALTLRRQPGGQQLVRARGDENKQDMHGPCPATPY